MGFKVGIVRTFCAFVVTFALVPSVLAVDIGTAAEFKQAITEDPSGEYRLTADIVFDSTQTTLESFSGTLDGDGHSISGLVYPIFNTLSGTVKELVIKDYTANAATVFPNAGNTYYGILAKVATDGTLIDHVMISNCVFVSARTVTQCVGGFIGRSTEAYEAGVSIRDSRLVDCRIGSTGAPSGGGYVGATDHGKLTVYRCEVENSEIIGSVAGGIIARTDAIGSTNDISYCIVGGTVSASAIAGGMIGGGRNTISSSTPSVVNISRCRNNAAVSAVVASGSSTIAGGIFGGTYRNGFITITDCENHGNITGNGKVKSSDDGYGVGGIGGGFLGNTGGAYVTLKFDGCVNYGDITATYTSAGGIVGHSGSLSSNPSFAHISNYGKITATDYAGGLFGYTVFNYNTMALRNIANYGAVESTGDNSTAAAFVAAYGGNSGYGVISNALNVASVTAKGYAGGFYGYCTHGKNGTATFKNCWLSGTLSAPVTGVLNGRADTSAAGTLTFVVDSRCRISVSGAQHTWYDQKGVIHDESLTPIPDGALTDGTAVAGLGPDWEQAPQYPGMKFESDCAPAAIAYYVTFRDYDGTQIEVQAVVRGSAAVAPPDPVREGYLFLGWNPSDFSCIVRDLIVTATYKSLKNTHDVTFVTWDNKLIEVVEVEDGYKVADRTAPDRTGYDFVGWTKDDEIYDFNTPVKAAFTLKAFYTIKILEVKFIDWNGQLIGPVQLVEYGGAAVAPELPELPRGTVFRKWSCAFNRVVTPLDVEAVIGHAIVFVSNNGADDERFGTMDAPFKTVPFALSYLGASGGTIEMFPETYILNDQITISTPVCIRKCDDLEGEVIFHMDRFGIGYGTARRAFIVSHAGASIIGVTVENGYVSAADSGKGGAGIYVSAGVISNCVVRNSQLVQSSGTAPHGGGIQLNGDSAVATHCIVSNCTTSSDNHWTGKSAAGIHVDKGRCENSLVADCRTDSGLPNPSYQVTVGGMVAGSATAKIVNCTVVDCYGSGCGGIYSESASAVVANCVVYGCEKRGSGTVTKDACSGNAKSFNTCAADVAFPAGSQGCLQGITSAAFMDYLGGVLVPSMTGPLYNTGSKTLASTSPFDLAGKKRVVKIIDIGAYESQYVPGFVITGRRIN